MPNSIELIAVYRSMSALRS